MRQTNVRGSLSLRGFRKLRTGAIVATGVILLGLGFLAPTVSANEQDGVWIARTVAEVKADIQKEGDLFKYVIKWGDTLSVISEASNIPVDVLQEMNQASGKNLFLPHNELYFTEAETISDTVTKHKIVIKESGASGEVRTYEVLLKKDQETKAVTFELTDVTEKVEKMAVNYSPVYQPVSAPVAPKAEEPAAPVHPTEDTAGNSNTSQPAEDSKEETGAPVTPTEESSETTGTTAVAEGTQNEPAAPVHPTEDTAGNSNTSQPAEDSKEETGAPVTPTEESSETTGTTAVAEGTQNEPAAPVHPTEDTAGNSNTSNEPKDNLEQGLKENREEIEIRKKNKFEEIDSSSLSPSKKEEARLKVEEYTNKAKEEMKQAKTTDNQAAVVDKYDENLATIATPGVEYKKPDYTNSGLSGNGPEGTHIGDNNVIGHGNSTPENTAFRNAPVYQPRVTRRPRSVSEPQNKVSIYYNFDGMKDIPGFFDDLGGENEVDIPKDVSGEALKSILKARIDKKKAELEKKGYKISDEYFVGIDQADATHYDYVVTFTKETTGTTGFRIAPKVQVRAKKVVKRDLSNKTKYINVYYNLTSLKDIAGALGELGGENVLTFSGETSKEELKRAVEEKTKAQIEKLKKQGFTVTSKTDLDQIIEGGDSYDYVVEFTKESKTQPVGTTGFRKAPLVQRRAKRSTEVKETVNVNIYFNLKTLPGIAGALDVDGDTTIKLPKNASKEEVKQAIKAKIAKVENRGYRVNDFYFGAKTEKGYDYVVEFTK